jgi:hypothetical protein
MRRLARQLSVAAGGRAGEDSWEDVAAAMVEVFSRDSDDTDVERRRAYNALLPKYRLLKKEPPAFLVLQDVRALRDEDLPGLFLEGEMQRIGAVLNRQNMDKLESAIALLQEVLDSAKKEDDDEEEPAEEPTPPGDETPPEPPTQSAEERELAALDALL